MQFLAYDDNFLPRVSFEAQQKRRRRRASSCCGVPISPIFRIHTFTSSRSTLYYEKLSPKPFNLTIRKLDGSVFGVEVVKEATVWELKKAVEAVFSHMPRKGPGKILWSHVWGHFCLCYGGWKLLADSEPISNYGINDGDQLQFVRHVSISYNLGRRRSKDRLSALERPRITDGFTESDQNGEKDYNFDDLGNSEHQHDDDGDENPVTRYELKLAQLFGRWFSYRRLGSPRRRFEGRSLSSKLTDGFLGSFRSIVRIRSSDKHSSPRDPLEEV